MGRLPPARRGVAARAQSPEERREFIQSITATTDSDLFEFLAEEVLDQQPEETRNFLLTTSILQQITAELAERLAGVHDGGESSPSSSIAACSPTAWTSEPLSVPRPVPRLP